MTLPTPLHGRALHGDEVSLLLSVVARHIRALVAPAPQLDRVRLRGPLVASGAPPPHSLMGAGVGIRQAQAAARPGRSAVELEPRGRRRAAAWGNRTIRGRLHRQASYTGVVHCDRLPRAAHPSTSSSSATTRRSPSTSVIRRALNAPLSGTRSIAVTAPSAATSATRQRFRV